MEGTCEWVLQRKEIHHWLQDPDTQMLWLHGAPGCGKSFLYSKLIGYLGIEKPVAYFLFCGGDKERVTFSSLLRAWCLQLVELYPPAFQYLQAIRHRNGTPTATEKEITELLEALLDILPPCYLTVDAIDECSDRELFLRRLRSIPKRFKILVTSRTPASIRKDLLRIHVPLQTLEVRPDLSRSDINHFITRSIDAAGFNCSEETRDRIRHRLSRCEGMFLWVKLMLDEIQSQMCEDDILCCLKELPAGLSETYARIIKEIERLTSRRLLAYKVFFWLYISRRPISVAELLVLLAIQPPSEALNEKRFIPDAERMALEACGGLIQYRGPDKKIFFTHFTVTEYIGGYLQQQNVHQEIMACYDTQQMRSSESLAAAVCLRYLSYQFVGGIQVPQDHAGAMALLKRSEPRFALLSYAVSNWFVHLEAMASPDEHVTQLALQFLDGSNREVWWHTFWFSNPESIESRICPSHFSSLHITAYFGLHDVTITLLDGVHRPLLDSAQRSPLWWSASRGHVEVSAALIEAGFDADAPDCDSITPAHRGAASGYPEVIQAMLCHADPGRCPVTDREGWTPLHWAASRGKLAVVHEILRHEKDRPRYGTRKCRCKSGRTPLHVAALNGYAEALSPLYTGLVSSDPRAYRLAHSDKDNLINERDSQGCTALHLAAVQGHQEVARELLKLGADPSITDRSGKTAAQKAYTMGNTDVYSLLTSVMDEVLELHLQTETAIQRTGEKVAEYKMKGLFGKVRDFNSVDTQDVSALKSLINGQLRMLDRLTFKGRSWVEYYDDRGRTALHYSVALGYERIVKKLFSAGAGRYFLNRQDDRGWTALHYAAAGQFYSVCKLLLERGAATDIKNDEFLTAFDLAIKEGHRVTIETIARYAPLSSDDISECFGWSKLHIDARDGTLSNIETLDPKQLQEQDAFGRSPLYRAVEMRRQEVARSITGRVALEVPELLDLSVLAESNDDVELMHLFLGRLPPRSLTQDPHLQRRAQRLFTKVIERNDVEATKALYQAGVDVNGGGLLNVKPERCPLQTAIHCRHSDIAIFLINRGADISMKDTGGFSCLPSACSKALPRVVECLLEHSADPNEILRPASPSWDSDAPLNLAFGYDAFKQPPEHFLAVARLLMQHGASLTTTCHGSIKPAAWVAVLAWQYCTFSNTDAEPPKCTALREFLIENGCGMLVQKRGDGGYVQIHRAAAENDVEALKGQLDAGIPPDWCTMYYPFYTPLQLAIKNSNLEAARLLLESGANPDCIFREMPSNYDNGDYNGDSADRREIIKLLLEELEPHSRGRVVDWHYDQHRANNSVKEFLSSKVNVRSSLSRVRDRLQSQNAFLIAMGSLLVFSLFFLPFSHFSGIRVSAFLSRE